MKKIFNGIIIAIVTSVFVVSFLIGRATALQKNNEEKKELYTGAVPIPKEESINTTNNAENVPIETNNDEVTDDEIKIPDRMIFPCGEVVQKDYTQTAVFSETMGDWRSHTGIDYAAEKGSDVMCVWDGIVQRVYKDKLWGNCIEISHGNGLKSVYKNLDKKITVSAGDAVFEGQVIGFTGKSADIESAQDIHLHFEMWQDNYTINPSSYVY